MKISDLRLFHNHMIIEPTLEVSGNFNSEVIKKTRDIFFDEFLKTNNYGLIFTFMWAFDLQEDWDYITNIINKFERINSEVYIVELIADQSVRLERNKTLNRLSNKKSKTDIDASTKRLIDEDSKYRLVSNKNEIKHQNYLRIHNDFISANEVAIMIKNKFNL